jgi:CheY-like chemotaxis protein
MAHVLIVDDDEDIRFTVRAMLEDLGEHTVSEAPDGPSALALLRAATEQYVVLLDLLMPNMDGIEVLREVARDQRLATRHAYILVTVSRRAGSEELSQSLALAVPVVPKPFSLDTLLDTVAQASSRLATDTP